MKRYALIACIGILLITIAFGCAKKKPKPQLDQYSVIEEKSKAPEWVSQYAYQQYTLAQQAFDQGNYQQAIELWKYVLGMGSKNFPYIYETRIKLGLAYFNLGDLSSAISEFQEAIKLDPSRVEGHQNLGNAYLKRGAYERAVIELKKTIAIKPDLDKAYLNLGVAYINQSRYHEAIDVLNRGYLIADEPSQKSFMDNIKIAYRQWGMALIALGKEEDALMKIQAAIELDPKDAMSYLVLARFYLEKGDYERAILLYQRAYEADPKKVAELGAKLVPYTPSDEAKSLKMAELFESKGNFKEAIKYYIDAVSAKPDESRLYLKIGDLYYKIGENKQAIEWYHRFLVKWPNDPMALEIKQHIMRIEGPREQGPVKVVGAWAGIGYDPESSSIIGGSDRFTLGTRVYRLCLIDNFFGKHKVVRRLFKPDGSVHYEETIVREFFVDRVPLVSFDVLKIRGMWRQVWIIDDQLQAEVAFEIY